MVTAVWQWPSSSFFLPSKPSPSSTAFFIRSVDPLAPSQARDCGPSMESNAVPCPPPLPALLGKGPWCQHAHFLYSQTNPSFPPSLRALHCPRTPKFPVDPPAPFSGAKRRHFTRAIASPIPPPFRAHPSVLSCSHRLSPQGFGPFPPPTICSTPLRGRHERPCPLSRCQCLCIHSSNSVQFDLRLTAQG
jgi:hypothetical protein